MTNNINKNVSVWRGDNTPPTEYHVWIKSNGSVLINKDGTWFTQISESTNDSVNVCNLSSSHHLTLEQAIDIVAEYLGTGVFHAGYKIRFNVNTVYEKANVWKEYILTLAAAHSILYKAKQYWKLLATSDLFDSNGEIRSQYLPSYVDDVLEFTSTELFPETGESDKIYLDSSTNRSYRWSGTQYVLIALTDIVTANTMGLMSPEMYQKLEKTASDLDTHNRQNQADLAEVREQLNKKVGKIVDSQGNIISNQTPAATIPDGTADKRGLLTPTIYKQIYRNKELSEYLSDHTVEEIKDYYGNVLPKVGTIVTIPNATTQTAGLMAPDDKIKLDGIESGSGSESEFVKELGLVSSTDEGDRMAARSEIAGNRNIFAIRYTTQGVSALKTTVIIQWCNGINESAQIKFVDKAQWRRTVTGATGVAGAPTNAYQWERTGAHYLGYDAASRTLQLKDYNQAVVKTVQLPLAQGSSTDPQIDGLLSGHDKMAIGSIITGAHYDAATGTVTFNNDRSDRVVSFTISTAADGRDGLMSADHVVEVKASNNHRGNYSNPHKVTKSQIGLGNVTNDAQVKRSEMGVANGVATLNSEGKISSSYLPSYVSAVITADSYTTLPATGEEDKIYVTKDTNLTYRWSGTAYVEISPSIALGETSTTAYAGDKGKTLSNSVHDLKLRVGNGWVVTDNMDFAIIGTGDTRVEIVPGARILASVVGRDSKFTISSNTGAASIGYGADIGQNSVLGAGFSASINDVRGPDGTTRQGLILKDVNDDNGIKILARNNGEFLVGTSVSNNNWIDLARLDKISTMINVSRPSGLSIYPSKLTGNFGDSEISIGTNTTIGSNVTIGGYSGIGEGAQISNYVKVSTSIEDDGTGYVLLGDGTTKIKKGVTIDGNSGSSEQLVHEYPGSWLIGEGLTPTETNATLGKGIVIMGTNATNQPILITAGGATALIGANFNVYSGVTLGSYSSLGNQAILGDNVEIIQGESGLVIVSNNYGMTVGTKVSIGNNVSLGNNSWLGQDSYLASGSHMGKNSVVQENAQIAAGVQIGESLTSDFEYYKLGETSGASLIMKNCAIEANIKHDSGANQIQIEDTNHTKYLYTGSGNTFGENNTIGNNVIISDDVSISTSVQVSDMEDEVSVGDITISTGISITKNTDTTTIQNNNGSSINGGKLQFGTGNVIWSGVEIGTGVHIIEDLTSDSTSYKLGETNQVIISKGINIYCSDTERALEITAPTTDGGAIYSYGKVTLGTNFTAAENTSLKVSLGTGSIDAVSYYQLKDPKSQLLTSSIGAGVTIQSGIQIKESDSGGIQIYVPSQAKWITIN